MKSSKVESRSNASSGCHTRRTGRLSLRQDGYGASCLHTWAISSAIWVANLPPSEVEHYRKKQLNGNVFVGVYQHSMTGDGTASHPSCQEKHASRSSLPNSSSSLRQSSSSRYARRNWQARDALGAVSRYAFEHGKTSNVSKLHKGMHTELRARYGLPSQLACSVERQVAATRHRTLDQTLEAC